MGRRRRHSQVRETPRVVGFPVGASDPPRTGPRALVAETYVYDNRYRMVQQTAMHTGKNVLVSRAYDYHPGGSLRSVDNPVDGAPGGPRDRLYGYDDMGRLTEATGPFGPEGQQSTITYGYDSIGNRRSTYKPWEASAFDYGYVRGSGGGDTPLLESVEETHYQSFDSGVVEWTHTTQTPHDDVGNLLGEGTVDQMAYSPRNDLLGLPNAQSPRYLYDADGYRVMTRGHTGHHTSRIYHYPDGRPLVERTVVWYAGMPFISTRSFVWIGERLVSTLEEDGSLRHVVSDHIAFPLLVYDPATGEVLWEAEAAPFGEIVNVVQGSTDGDPGLRYPGQWAEPPGDPGGLDLTYNVHRWYKAEWGRYTQGDPLLITAGGNQFSYGINDPLRRTDSDGLFLNWLRCFWYKWRCASEGTECSAHWKCVLDEKGPEWEAGAYERAERIAGRKVSTRSDFLYVMCFRANDACRKALEYCGKGVIKPPFNGRPG